MFVVDVVGGLVILGVFGWGVSAIVKKLNSIADLEQKLQKTEDALAEALAEKDEVKKTS